MATWYVCTYLRLKNDSNLSVEGALQVSCGVNPVSTQKRLEEALLALEAGSLTPQQLRQLPSLINKAKSEAFAFGHGGGSESTKTPCGGLTIGAKKAGTTDISTKIQKKGRKYGANKLDSRLKSNWLKLEASERVDTLMEYSKLNYKDLTNKARQFLYNWAIPVANCVERCHKGSRASFVEIHPSIRQDLKLEKFMCSGQCAGNSKH
jgi:hypothetical protein